MSTDTTGHDGQEETIVCTYPGCGKILNSKWSMTRHLRSHTGEKPFKCTYPGCGKDFIERCALKRHEQTHTKTKVWSCDHPGCGKKFKLKEYLDVHKRTHSSEVAKVNKAQVNDFVLQPMVARPDHVMEAPESRVVLEQLRNRLVRMSVRHHEELATQLREGEWLKQSLLECSNALHEAIALLRAQDEQNKAAVVETDQRSIPKSLTETAAKFNIENISAACKSSIAPPSSGEQLSFLNMCKNGAAAGYSSTKTDTDKASSNSGVKASAGGVTATSTTKGATMTLIESLMNSALNADRVLTTLGTGCNPNAEDELQYNETETGQNSGGESEGDPSMDDSNRVMKSALQLQQLSSGSRGDTMSAHDTLTGPPSSSSVGSMDSLSGLSNVGNAEFEMPAQPSFFKFLQRDSSGTYNLKPSSQLMSMVNKSADTDKTIDRDPTSVNSDSQNGINILAAAVISDNSGGSVSGEDDDEHRDKRIKTN